MGFTKYQSVEDAAKPVVESPEEHRRIQSELNKLGKTSAQELTPEEREAALNKP